MGVELRTYQVEAVDAISAAWADHNDALLCMATGTGKTIVFSSLVSEHVSTGQNALIMAHRKELLYQAEDKLLAAYNVPSSFELGKRHYAKSGVCISSMQTMDIRMNKFDPNTFSMIVIDEAHHSSCDTYRKILDYFTGFKLLGVTATPDRGDGQNMRDIFPNGVTYEYGLKEAIEDGNLCRIMVEQVPIEIDLRNVRITRKGDYNEKDLDRVIEPTLEDCAMAIISRFGKDNRIAVFLPTIDSAVSMAQTINSRAYILPDGSRSLTAEAIGGKFPDRDKILKRLHTGETNVICSVALLTEGWDEPAVDVVVPLRPTKSRALYAQMVGRGTRLYDGKDHLVLLDMMGQTDVHDLCRPASLLIDDEEVIQVASNLSGDLLSEAASAERAVADRKAAAEKALKNVREYEKYDLLEGSPRRRQAWRKLVAANDYCKLVGRDFCSIRDGRPLTSSQVDTLERLGIRPNTVFTAESADALIKDVRARSSRYLATPKQMRLLQRQGFTRVDEWTKGEASEMISALSQRKWKLPAWYRPADHLPPRLNRPEPTPSWIEDADAAEEFSWDSWERGA